MKLIYRPLGVNWPSGTRTPASQRRWPKFKVTWERNLRDLERELRHLGVSYYDDVVIEAGFRPSDIRLDGQPRGNARQPDDPAVVLAFQSRYGPLRYGCDNYTTYQSNLRAITLALEALRAVDRYGVTKRGEQYVGWKQLAAPGENNSSHDAAALLASLSVESPISGRQVWTAEQILANPDAARSAYRIAARKLHPDVGGSREDWARLQRAKEALGI